jgi:hypothetical protein
MDDHAMQQLEADCAHTLRALLARAEKAEEEIKALELALDIVVNEPQKAKVKRLTTERDTAWNDAIEAAAECVGHITQAEDRDAILALIEKEPGNG